MTNTKPDEKKKFFRLKKELAYELELYAKQKHVSEVELVRRYIKEGLMRDKGQTTLDWNKLCVIVKEK